MSPTRRRRRRIAAMHPIFSLSKQSTSNAPQREFNAFLCVVRSLQAPVFRANLHWLQQRQRQQQQRQWHFSRRKEHFCFDTPQRLAGRQQRLLSLKLEHPPNYSEAQEVGGQQIAHLKINTRSGRKGFVCLLLLSGSLMDVVVMPRKEVFFFSLLCLFVTYFVPDDDQNNNISIKGNKCIKSASQAKFSM